MKDARATMLRSYWPPDPTPFQRFMKTAGAYTRNKTISLFQGLEKISLVVRNPMALLSGMESVQRARLALAIEELRSIPEGAALTEIVNQGLKLRLDNRLGSGGVSRQGKEVKADDGEWIAQPGEIVVNGISTKGMLILVLAHELQHQRQNMENVMQIYHQKKLPSPPEVLWYNRATEADAHVTAIDIAWKLKEAGKPAAWKYVRNINSWREMARKYEEAALKDPSSIADGRAKRAAFDQWFILQPRNRLGITISQIYNGEMLVLLPEAATTKRWAESGIRVEPLTATDIEKIGDISAVNYLKAPGGRPLDDPYYRKADWNMEQAAFLARRQQEYDSIKAQFAKAASRQQPEQATPETATGTKQGPLQNLKVWI